jgi:hypothetical protein
MAGKVSGDVDQDLADRAMLDGIVRRLGRR